jgi:uncharacterized membrane protein YjfL (UPF0719 family)
MHLSGIISTLEYWAIGLILFIIGYYSLVLLCKVMKVNLNKVIDDHNTAAGVAVAGFIVAIGIIISGAMQ